MIDAKFIAMNIKIENKELLRHKRLINSKITKNFIYKSESGSKVIIKVLKNYTIISKRMNSIIMLVDSLICKYQKVFALRFDLHHKLENTEDSNFLLQKFLKQLKQNLKQAYKSDVKAVWSCEKCKSQNHHYHLAIFLNGNKVNSPQNVFKLVRTLWGKISDGNAPFMPYVHYNVIRKSDERFWITLQALLLRLSYLAKKETDYKPAGGTKFSFGKSHTVFI